MVNSGNRKVFFRLFQLGAVGLLAIIGLVDLQFGMGGAGGLALLEVLSAVAAAAVWLRGCRRAGYVCRKSHCWSRASRFCSPSRWSPPGPPAGTSVWPRR